MSREKAVSGDTGLVTTFFENRERLQRFLEARGAGADAEDLLQEIWMRIMARDSGPIGSPLSYLYRVANLIMIDRYRSFRQARRRESAWFETKGTSTEPSAERALIASEQLRMVAATLDACGPRAAAIFRRHRLDGVPQRKIAEELNISLSTVESDLRKTYSALAGFKRRLEDL